MKQLFLKSLQDLILCPVFVTFYELKDEFVTKQAN